MKDAAHDPKMGIAVLGLLLYLFGIALYIVHERDPAVITERTERSLSHMKAYIEKLIPDATLTATCTPKGRHDALCTAIVTNWRGRVLLVEARCDPAEETKGACVPIDPKGS